MIEKLDEIDIETFPMGDAGAQFLTILAHINGAKRKINELVDTVNELQTRPENVQPDAESRSENVQDKFAEQRRWIGCVCRFWYDNPNDTLLDYLDKIQTGKNGVEYYAKESGDWFPHCEPVKPDEDIIYQGCDNE